MYLQDFCCCCWLEWLSPSLPPHHSSGWTWVEIEWILPFLRRRVSQSCPGSSESRINGTLRVKGRISRRHLLSKYFFSFMVTTSRAGFIFLCLRFKLNWVSFCACLVSSLSLSASPSPPTSRHLHCTCTFLDYLFSHDCGMVSYSHIIWINSLKLSGLLYPS